MPAMRLLPAFAALSVAAASTSSCGLRKFENLVTFGDSWTDTGRLEWLAEHLEDEPPVGVLPPESNVTATGGLAWGQFVANSTGVEYFNYAVAGASSSDEIVLRYIDDFGIPYPSVLDYQVPAFEADVAAGLYDNRKPDNTLYAVWIGTNDLGIQGFLGDSQVPGTTLSTFVDSIWTTIDRLYKAGGRNFVLFNEPPLEISPLYTPSDEGGFQNSQFWPSKLSYNTTQYSQKLAQYTTSVNTMFNYGVPFQLSVQKRWKGASITIYDVNTLMREIYSEPEKYLTAPADVKGVYYQCDPVTEECVPSSDPLSSFMWFDELHHSERTAEVIAKNFVDVVAQESRYGTYYS